MTKDSQPSHPESTETTPPFSQDVHDFLVLQQLIPQPDTSQRTRNTLWLVQETLLHRMQRDDRRQVFSALHKLRQQRVPSTDKREEASHT
jgi:hypothetical protein